MGRRPARASPSSWWRSGASPGSSRSPPSAACSSARSPSPTPGCSAGPPTTSSCPPSRTARSPPGCCGRCSRCSSASRILRAVGIVARRLGAGVMQYRMQAHYRRAVTRQYLSLPLEWHQRHPTGQLLSNANSDVEAAWGPIAPLPMAVGTVAMMVIAVAQMFARRRRAGGGRPARLPCRRSLANLAYQRLASPLMTRAQALRAEVSEIAHESFDGAMVVKTLGREAEETERFAAQGPRAARRQHPRRPDPRRVRPDARRAAQPRRAGRAGRRRGPGASSAPPTPATSSPSPTCSPSCPSRSARSAGCSGSSRAASSASSGCSAVLDATGEMQYGDRASLPAAEPGRPARGRRT